MYLKTYGLREPPFAPAPDPRLAIPTKAGEALLARLEHEIRAGSGGIMLVSGDIGYGKTLLSQQLVERLQDAPVRVARIFNPGTSAVELMQAVCHALRVPLEGWQRDNRKALFDALSAFLMDLYAQGSRALLLVDEAQNLSDEALEELRLLTNLETPAHKLIHILLLASPSLYTRLQTSALQPLAQRITLRGELPPLDASELEHYLRHRLEVAGAPNFPFTRLGVRALHRYSGGVPRLVNRIADRALKLGAAADLDTIGERSVQRAARECLQGHVRYWLYRYRRAAIGVIVLALALAAAAWVLHRRSVAPSPQPATQAPAEAAVAARVDRLIAELPARRTGQLLAWSELLARWQIGASDVSVADAARCTATLFPGFACVGGTGTLDQLKRFDRPMVLRLETAAGVRDVLLLGVGEHDVRLDLGPRDVDVPRAVLEKIWRGRFFAPYRVPAWMPTRIRRGDTGREVAWVEAHLRRLDQDTGGSYGPAVFNAALEARVRRLQRAFGIPDDGVIGPETLFALASLEDDGPHLARNVR
jgi:general secretion pathway protein A